jgi:hypothetical protein
MENTNIQTNCTEGAECNAEGPVHTTERREWTKEFNKLLMEYHLLSEPTKRGFRKRMLAIWNDSGLFSATEQQLAGQVRCIKNRRWLSSVEIEEIQRAVDKESENGAGLTEVEEAESNVNAQHQETEIRQKEATESQGIDETEEELELDVEEKCTLEMRKKKLEMSENLEPVNLRYEDKKKVADLVGRKEKRTGKKQEPVWRRRMKKQIKDLESDITRTMEGR